MTRPTPSVTHLVLIPALITLAVTIARLVGELTGHIGTEAGGQGEWLGIVWLVPIFGLYLGFRLGRPERPGKSLAIAALIAALYVGGNFGLMQYFGMDQNDPTTFPHPSETVVFLGAVNLPLAIAALLVGKRLFAVHLLYALLARIPVAAVILLDAVFEWNTHYAKFPPGSGGAELSGLEGGLWMASYQLVFWLPLTIVAGVLFGSLAGLVAKKG